MKDIWHAETYAKFLEYRTRPAKDLLFAIPESFTPKIVYDLGCGPGNSTILLKQRWKHAEVIGVDSSADMLKKAQKTYPDLQFLTAEISNFNPKKLADCVFSNAALQWLDHHAILLPKLFSSLNDNGILAIQISNNFHAPSHQAIVEILTEQKRWNKILESLRYRQLTEPFYQVAEYYDIFTNAKAQSIQLWETIYWQEMPNQQAIFHWLQGTGLRPVLTQMNSTEQAEFEKQYLQKIAIHYPNQCNGKVLFPFQRLFMLVSK